VPFSFHPPEFFRGHERDFPPEQYDLQTAALKVPPHSIEAEQAVLGGLMLDNNAWERVLDQVSDGDFYRHDHRLIFRAIAKLADANHRSTW
jgi:replicative DNA helicase